MNPPPPSLEAACPICSSSAQKEYFLSVDSWFPEQGSLNLYHCPSCASFFYYPAVSADYDHDYGIPNFEKHFLEIGAGIETMLQPLLQLGAQPGSSFLDVGCACGFTLDFCTRYLGWQSEGVEPSNYGRSGAAALGVRIHHEYLEKVEELAGRRFDIVYCSEVIEHVPAPLNFAHELASRVAEEGILILTTPNGAAVSKTAPETVLQAILCPGVHLQLFSPQALEELCHDLGFAYVTVQERNERQFVFASRRHLVLINDDRTPPGLLTAYLKNTLDRVEPGTSLYMGLAYRLLREYANNGRYSEAITTQKTLEQACIAQYGPRIFDGGYIGEQLAVCQGFADFGQRFPYFLAAYFYYAGMLDLNVEREAGRATARFGAAVRIISKTCTFTPRALGMETNLLLWRARFHEGVALQHAGQLDRTRAIFGDILAGHPGLPSVPADIRERSILELFLSLVSAERFVLAGEYLARVSTLVEDLSAQAQTRAADLFKGLYARAFFFLNYSGGYLEAAHDFAECFRLSSRPESGAQDMMWMLKFHEGLAMWHANRPVECREAIAAILAIWEEGPPAGVPRPTEELVRRICHFAQEHSGYLGTETIAVSLISDEPPSTKTGRPSPLEIGSTQQPLRPALPRQIK